MYFSYEEAKSLIKNFNFKSSYEFRKYINSGKRIENVPKSPYHYYKYNNKGWISWEDFLSFNKIKKNKYLKYIDAVNIVSKLGLKSVIHWKIWIHIEKNKNPNFNIPLDPYHFYKKEWISWNIFLGNEKKYSSLNNSNIQYMNYEDCKLFISMNFSEIKSLKLWQKLDKTLLPLNVPKRPDYIYKNKGWISWEDFLNIIKISFHKKYLNFLNYQDAVEYIQKLNFFNEIDYYNYVKDNNINFLPTRPDNFYKNNGWKGYTEFLGYESSKTSYGERKINEVLINSNIKFEREKVYNSCRNILPLSFDFYLIDYNILIEFDGQQHFKSYEYYGGEEGLKKQQLNDSIKDKWCIENNINLIRISYKQKNKIEEIISNLIK